MNDAKVILIIIVCLVIFGPVIFELILKKCQNIDFNNQLEGKIPERNYNEDNSNIYIDKETTLTETTKHQMYRDACDLELKMRSIQNILGPK